MTLQALPPEKAKSKTKANFDRWKKEKKKEGKRERIEARSGKAKPRTKGKPPLTEPIVGIDWSKLDLDKVETMITKGNGVPAWEAIERADKEGKIIIPNCIHDRILVETDHWTKPEIKAGYVAWTGTGVVYESPDKAFGENVVFGWKEEQDEYSVSFSIPKQFQGKKNCILVVEHPNFIFDTKGNNQFELKIKDENLITLVEHFPGKEGWYIRDERFRIPVGNQVDSPDSNERPLWRIDDGSYVGLLARQGYSIGIVRGILYDRRSVYAHRRPSVRLGVHTVEKSSFLSLGS